MSSFEPLSFFWRYVRNPSSIGAVCPSSRFLARKMVNPLKESITSDSVVVELGSGTGAVTKHILTELSIDPKKLYCVEFDSDSAKVLSEKFPSVNVANDTAENIVPILGGDIVNLKCIVSCLPLLSLPDNSVRAVLKKVEEVLPEGGLFVQFTYNLCASPAEKYFRNLKRIKTDFTLFNVPPARVDVFRK